jgi:hypothetical protein
LQISYYSGTHDVLDVPPEEKTLSTFSSKTAGLSDGFLLLTLYLSLKCFDQ